MRPFTLGKAKRSSGAASHKKGPKLALARLAGVVDPRLAAIVESSDVAILAEDLSGVVFAWNRAAERMFGYAASEMIGQPLTVIFPPDQLDEEAFILRQIARGESVEQYETAWRSKDGRVITVSFTVLPIRDAGGGIIGVSKIVRNLTERDPNSKRIQRLQAELAHVQRLTDLGQVAATLVHEVNQPITAIRNYIHACQRLAATGKLTGVRTALERMEDQIKGASEIIQRIRDFAKKRDVQMQAEDLSLVIDEAVSLIRASLAEELPVLTVQVDPAEPNVEIDKVQVQQVLFNLMRNGIEATQHQSGRELMIATQRAKSGMVEISVADNGAGLAADVRSRLFHPFVTTKPTGMGVGLSVCQGIVELHGGRIWADDDTVGGGAVFRFTVRSAGGRSPHDAWI
jgi:two-component system sensor kinase FixL